MDDIQKPTVEKLINNVIIAENIFNPIVKYTFSDVKHGFIAHIANVEISGSNKTLKLIVKYPSTLDDFRENIRGRELYCQEILFYSKIYPLFQKLQEKYEAVEPFNKIAKCYGTDDTMKCEMIVLEDLIPNGFQLYDKNKPLDVKHIKLLLGEYAKFHAVSLAHKHRDLNEYKKFMNSTTAMFGVFEQSGIIKILVNACVNVKEFLEPGSKLSEAYNKFCDNIPTIWRNGKIDDYAVLCHGDNWVNNFMFKYEDSDKISDVRFLDFQGVGPGSLVYDLSYFLFANSPYEVIDNIDYYLNFYYDNLALRLKEMNCPPEEVFSYKVFKDQWRKYSKPGLMMGITALKVTTAAPDETIDLTKDFENAVNFVGANIDVYKKRALHIINYFYEAGII